MKTFYAEAVVCPDHKVEIDYVPFVEGQSVVVFMAPLKKNESHPPVNLRGSILSYDSPFQAISQDE